MSRREELIAKAQEVAKSLGRRKLALREFCRHTGINMSHVYLHFDGWRDLCLQAGLEANDINVRLGDDTIFAAMRDTFVKVGGVPTRTKFDKNFSYGVDVFKRRGMGWPEALQAFRKWAEQKDPNFPFMDQLPIMIQQPRAVRVAAEPYQSPEPPAASRLARGGRLFGDLVNFRGLLHAPVNEQGVVFLFGMVAHELGYAVEMVTTGFPDCEAKRRVSKGRWERVRIEFEYQSRNFRDHGHDPGRCDVVVCWEHNWPECPVEILELRSRLDSLPSHRYDLVSSG